MDICKLHLLMVRYDECRQRVVTLKDTIIFKMMSFRHSQCACLIVHIFLQIVTNIWTSNLLKCIFCHQDAIVGVYWWRSIQLFEGPMDIRHLPNTIIEDFSKCFTLSNSILNIISIRKHFTCSQMYMVNHNVWYKHQMKRKHGF
jgi:hypothetical protein